MPEDLVSVVGEQLTALRDRIDAHQFVMLALISGLKRLEKGEDLDLRTTLEQVRDIVTKNVDEARKKEMLDVFSAIIEFYDDAKGDSSP